MVKYMRKLLLFAVVLLLSSCSAHFYDVKDYNISQTQVVLDEANFEVVGVAEGSASVTRVFGIGGLSYKSLQGNAVADMYKSANLKGSQAIINVSFKVRKSGFMPIYSNTEYTATGIIVEFK